MCLPWMIFFVFVGSFIALDTFGVLCVGYHICYCRLLVLMDL